MTPTWVHFDRRYGKAACSGTTSGYPKVQYGDRGCYVMILQDGLSALGYPTGTSIDGKFGRKTERALMAWQCSVGLAVDGICGCNSWKKLTAAALGMGRTPTTID